MLTGTAVGNALLGVIDPMWQNYSECRAGVSIKSGQYGYDLALELSLEYRRRLAVEADFRPHEPERGLEQRRRILEPYSEESGDYACIGSCLSDVKR